MRLVEQYAWHWVIRNEQTYEELAGFDGLHMIRYADLCLDPMGQAKQLLTACGLPWHTQTERFVTSSTHTKTSDRYYQVFKNPIETLNRWRTQLSTNDQALIRAVALAGSLWLGLGGDATL